MKNLRDRCKDCGEVEVWDEYIDIANPYYNYDGDFSFEDNDEEHNLHMVEWWILSLPVTTDNGYSVCVDCYTAIREIWDSILAKMEEEPSYRNFLDRYEDHQDDEMIAEFVEDIFTTLSQGMYKMAEDLCWLLDIRDKRPFDVEQVITDYEHGKINEIEINHMPYRCGVYSMPELTDDLSQGTGNVVVFHYYDTYYNIVISYVSF